MINDSDALANISYNLNRLLAAAEMSRYRLAKITGESEQTIKSVADGAHMPRVSLMARIAEAFGVKVDDLLAPIPSKKKTSRKFQEVA